MKIRAHDIHDFTLARQATNPMPRAPAANPTPYDPTSQPTWGFESPKDFWNDGSSGARAENEMPWTTAEPQRNQTSLWVETCRATLEMPTAPSLCRAEASLQF